MRDKEETPKINIMYSEKGKLFTIEYKHQWIVIPAQLRLKLSRALEYGLSSVSEEGE